MPKLYDSLRVIDAVYVGDYTVRVSFNDGTAQVVDVGPFLRERPHPQYNKCRDFDQFKHFSVEMGNVVWGENWDLIFPVEQLYKGKIE